MQIKKGFKYQNESFGSKTFEVVFTHQELGLADPTSVEELRNVLASLSFEAEALLAIELVKLGRLHPQQIKERLHPWIQSSNPSGS